jgi:hypothetical protein
MAFKSLLDPTFSYRNAANTDLRITFERVRREQQEAQRQRECDAAKVIAIIGNALQSTNGRLQFDRRSAPRA